MSDLHVDWSYKELLDSHAVAEPVIARLTQIGTVEGFGSMIRYSPIPELQRCFVEDVRGTATWHLGGGLYEAHARDEAGYKGEGGHKQMWFAARDIAFERPLTEDQTQVMMDRMLATARPPPLRPSPCSPTSIRASSC